MAGAGYKLFNTGDVLTAAQVNTYLMEQTVMVFADAAARTTALTGVVSEGMLSYLKSTKQVEVYNGTAWVASDDPNAIQNTIVDAKGDLIAATANDTPARLAVGSNGDTLVADSASSVGLRYNPPVGSLANPVVNGGTDVWQRGTTFSTFSNTTTFTADRFYSYRSGLASGLTVSRQTVSDSANLPNLQFAMRVQRDSGNTSTAFIATLMDLETTNSIPFAGKTVTLSFYARAGANYSASGSALSGNFYTGTGTDQALRNGYTGSVNTAISATLTTTWQRFVTVVNVGATAKQIGLEFTFNPVGTAGANDWFEITGIQIDVGTWTASTAPTFRRSGGTIQGEIALAQRYYYRTSPTTGYKWLGFGNAVDTTNVKIALPLPSTMRVEPTSVETSAMSTFYIEGGTGAVNTPSSVTLNGGTTANFGVVTVAKSASFTTGTAYSLLSNNTTAYLGFSAEL